MSTAQQAPVEQRVLVPINPTVVDTPSGLVMVWGFEHVSPKMLEVLRIILSHDGFESVSHGIKSIVFRIDGYPKINGKSICASFSPDVSGVSINLEKTLERSIDRSMDHPETCLLASWWLEMLLNFGHELHHGARWNTDCNKLHNNKETLADEESRAEKYSDSLIVELAKEYDIEMAGIEEETWFNGQITELLDGKDESDKWAKAQKEMITEKIVWRHEPKDSEIIVLHTFKDFVCLVSNGDIESEEWSKPTIPLDPNLKTFDEQLNGKKVTVDATGKQGIVDPGPDKELVDVQPVLPSSNEVLYYGGNEEGSDEIIDDFDEQPIVAAAIQPLPPAANAVQPVINYANQASPQPQPQAAQYDMATINRIAQGVYMKMYNFIFTHCGPLRDSDVGFNNPEAVLNTTIPLTPEEAAIFVTMDHMDINGRWCPGVSTANGLLGKVMKNTKLPSYEVTLNVNGTIHRRLFIPQNPAKRNNGVLTQRASETRAGNAIAYIIAKDDASNNKWGPYIINGEYKLPQAR